MHPVMSAPKKSVVLSAVTPVKTLAASPPTPLAHASRNCDKSTRDHNGLKSVPTKTPRHTGIPVTNVSNLATRLGRHPTAASTPSVRCCEERSNPKHNHNKISAATTRKLESVKKRIPNGVDPLAATLARSANRRTPKPTDCGGIAAASSKASLSIFSCESDGRCHAVVFPKRLPAISRALTNGINILGADPNCFQ